MLRKFSAAVAIVVLAATVFTSTASAARTAETGSTSQIAGASSYASISSRAAVAANKARDSRFASTRSSGSNATIKSQPGRSSGSTTKAATAPKTTSDQDLNRAKAMKSLGQNPRTVKAIANSAAVDAFVDGFVGQQRVEEDIKSIDTGRHEVQPVASNVTPTKLSHTVKINKPCPRNFSIGASIQKSTARDVAAVPTGVQPEAKVADGGKTCELTFKADELEPGELYDLWMYVADENGKRHWVTILEQETGNQVLDSYDYAKVLGDAATVARNETADVISSEVVTPPAETDISAETAETAETESTTQSVVKAKDQKLSEASSSVEVESEPRNDNGQYSKYLQYLEAVPAAEREVTKTAAGVKAEWVIDRACPERARHFVELRIVDDASTATNPQFSAELVDGQCKITTLVEDIADDSDYRFAYAVDMTDGKQVHSYAFHSTKKSDAATAESDISTSSGGMLASAGFSIGTSVASEIQKQADIAQNESKPAQGLTPVGSSSSGGEGKGAGVTTSGVAETATTAGVNPAGTAASVVDTSGVAAAGADWLYALEGESSWFDLTYSSFERGVDGSVGAVFTTGSDCQSVEFTLTPLKWDGEAAVRADNAASKFNAGCEVGKTRYRVSLPGGQRTKYVVGLAVINADGTVSAEEHTVSTRRLSAVADQGVAKVSVDDRDVVTEESVVVEVFNSQLGQPVNSFTFSKDGSYELPVTAGTYFLRANKSGPLTRLEVV